MVQSAVSGPVRGGQEEHLEAMGDKEKKKKDKTSDRVTLKKEIGLLSACAIIIGECVTAFVLSGVFMKCCSA